MGTSADVGVIGGSGFYSLFDQAEKVPVSTPYGEPAAPLTVGQLTDRSRGLRPAPWQRPSLCAASGAVPREPVGVALPRRATGPRGVGGRLADDRIATGQAGGARPGRRPHVGTGAHLLRRQWGRARLLRRPVLRPRPGGGGRGRRRCRRRHARRGERAAVLLPRRVAGVPGARVVDHRHDRDARGRLGPRARTVLHACWPWSPIWMPGSRPARALRTPRCSPHLPPTCPGCGNSLSPRLPACLRSRATARAATRLPRLRRRRTSRTYHAGQRKAARHAPGPDCQGRRCRADGSAHRPRSGGSGSLDPPPAAALITAVTAASSSGVGAPCTIRSAARSSLTRDPWSGASQRDVPVLLRRQRLPLVTKHPQRLDDERAGMRPAGSPSRCSPRSAAM